VRDDRPWGGSAPPGAVYYFSTDRKGQHPQSHLAEFEGILQADVFSGYKKLYESDATGAVREAACWAHLRRDFHDAWIAAKSVIAREALDRIGALYDIEHEITGQSAEQRKAVRQKPSRPKVEAFKSWAEAKLGRIPARMIWPKRSVTVSNAGRPSPCSLMMGTSPSTITLQNEQSSRL